jgi:hypothetical protein
MFIAALFTITQLWKQDALQLKKGSRKCGIYTQMAEFHSAIRNNDTWFEGKWM